MTQALDEVQTYLDNTVTERARAWGEASEILARCATDGNRAMTVDEATKYHRIAGRKTTNADGTETYERGVLDDLGDQIQSFADRISRERENDTLRAAYAGFIQPTDDGTRGNATESDDFLNWRQKGGALEIGLTEVANAKSMIRAGANEREVRDLLVGTTTAGGYTVPTTLARQLYDFLEVYSGIRQTNVTVLTRGSGEPFDMPTVTAHGTAAIVGEGTALAEADPALGKVTLTTYKYGQLLQISSELLQDTAVDITGFIAKDMGRAIGRVTDNAYLNGSGTNSPTGALVKMGTATTIQTVATGVPSYNNLVDTVYSINDLYLANTGVSWLMRQAMAGAIRKLVDTQGRPIWEPSIQVGQPDMLLGYPVYHDPNMGAVGTAASTAIAFGDWSPFIISQVNTIRLEASTDFAFSSDLTTYRCIFRTASNLVDLTGAVKKVLEPTT